MKLGLLSIILLAVLFHLHLGAPQASGTRGPDASLELRGLAIPLRRPPTPSNLGQSMTFISHQQFTRPGNVLDGTGNRMDFEDQADTQNEAQATTEVDGHESMGMGLSPNIPSSRITKRNSEETTPWSCTTEYTWTDLGSNYFPRFVKTAQCSGSCFNGFYHCAPASRPYTLKVLKSLEPGERYISAELPYPINDTVKLISVPVHAWCECRFGPAPAS